MSHLNLTRPVAPAPPQRRRPALAGVFSFTRRKTRPSVDGGYNPPRMAPRAGHGQSRRWIARGAVALALLLVPAAASAATGSGQAHAAAKTATSILHTTVPAKGKYLLIVYVRSRSKHSRQVNVYIPGQRMRTVVANPWWGAAVYYRLNLSPTGLVVRTVNAPPAVQVRASLKLRNASSSSSSTTTSANGAPPGPTTTTTTTVTTTPPVTTPPVTTPPVTTPNPIVAPYTKQVFADNFQTEYGAGQQLPSAGTWGFDNWGGCGGPSAGNPRGTVSQNNTGSLDGISSSQNAYLTPNGLAITAVSVGGGNYVSAQLDTSGRFSQQYGMVEASIWMPAAQGLCPGFWMLGDSNIAGGSSSPGEIDVVEAPSFGGGLGSPAYFDLHGFSVQQVYNTSTSAVNLSSGFHTYAIVWTPTSISWLIDGTVYASATQASLVAGGSWANDFSYARFHLILDLAVGGWPCDTGTCGPTQAPAPSYTMYVQWVKWFQQP